MRKLTDTEYEEFVNLVDSFNREIQVILWNKKLNYNRLSELKGIWSSINKTIEYIKSDDTYEPADKNQLKLFDFYIL